MVDRATGIKTISYTDEILREPQRTVSRERLSTCLDVAGGDRVEAIRLPDLVPTTAKRTAAGTDALSSAPSKMGVSVAASTAVSSRSHRINEDIFRCST